MDNSILAIVFSNTEDSFRSAIVLLFRCPWNFSILWLKNLKSSNESKNVSMNESIKEYPFAVRYDDDESIRKSITLTVIVIVALTVIVIVIVIVIVSH